jgi:hypothetical protein
MKVAQYGPSFSWPSVAEILHLQMEEIEGKEETELRIKGERLRQFAKGQISREARSGTTDENLDLIVRFLTHSEIKLLTLEDLKEPDLPYQFAFQLMEFLRDDEDSDLALPPQGLEGTYRTVIRSRGEIYDLRVEIIVSRDGHFVHLIEKGDIFTDAGAKDPAEWSPGERKRYYDRYTESRGWGILTPEDTLMGFMKRKFDDTYTGNHYFSTIASIPEFGKKPVQAIALIAYHSPYYEEDKSKDRVQWFEEISQKVLSNNLRHFIRIPVDCPSLMGS